MGLRRILSVIVALVLCWPALAQQTTSTINPNIPVPGVPVEQGGPALRQNFLAAENDINVLFGLSSGGDRNTLNRQTSNYQVAPTDCGATIQAGTGSTGQFSITLPSVSGFASNCSILVKNGDSARGKMLVGFPGDAPLILWPLQSIGVKVVNGVWSAFYKPGRWQVGNFGGATFNIDNVLGNDANDGLAPGTGAFRTFAGAMIAVLPTIDSQNQNIFVNLAAGQSWSNLVLTGNLVGGGVLFIDGGGGTIDGTGANAAFVVNGGNNAIVLAFIRNVTITCSTGQYGLLVVSGQVGLGIKSGSSSSVTMGSCPNGAHFWADSPYTRIIALGDYAITGGAKYHMVAANGGHADFDSGVTVTVTGTPAFSQAFAYSFGGGILISNQVYSGSATGIRYEAANGGLINTGGGGGNVFPGSIAGFVGLGGLIDAPGAPTAACAGGTAAPTVTGTDKSGHLTEGTASTGCTITFSTSNAPFACTVNTSNATAAAAMQIAVSTTTLTWVHPSSSAAAIYWTCPAQGD